MQGGLFVFGGYIVNQREDGEEALARAMKRRHVEAILKSINGTPRGG